MNKHLGTVVVIVVFLAVFIPFASSSPDGLERVFETFGAAEHTPFWNGIMSNYTIAAIGDPYVSTLLAGVFGTFMVLLATFLLGKAMAPKKTTISDKQ
jgi:cobalt/nickel transport protein